MAFRRLVRISVTLLFRREGFLKGLQFFLINFERGIFVEPSGYTFHAALCELQPHEVFKILPIRRAGSEDCGIAKAEPMIIGRISIDKDGPEAHIFCDLFTAPDQGRSDPLILALRLTAGKSGQRSCPAAGIKTCPYRKGTGADYRRRLAAGMLGHIIDL